MGKQNQKLLKNIEKMRVECKTCKRNLTFEAIKFLEGKIKRIICKCKQVDCIITN